MFYCEEYREGGEEDETRTGDTEMVARRHHPPPAPPPTLTTPKRSPDQKLQINSENVTPSVFVPTRLDKNQFLEILIGG